MEGILERVAKTLSYSGEEAKRTVDVVCKATGEHKGKRDPETFQPCGSSSSHS